MRCAICKAELVQTEDRRFETLCEHVSGSNQEQYPLRPGENARKHIRCNFEQLNDNYGKVFKWYLRTFYKKLKQEIS